MLKLCTHPSPTRSGQSGLKGLSHLVPCFERVNHITPHTVRHPGAMPLNVLRKTLLLKACVAPKRLNVWNVLGVSPRANFDKIVFKCHLTWPSLRGNQRGFVSYFKRGEFFPWGDTKNKFLMAATEQMSLFKVGRWTILTLLFNCMVLLHFMNRAIESFVVRISYFVKCFKG